MISGLHYRAIVSWDEQYGLNLYLYDPRESAEHRSGLNGFYMDGTDTKKAFGAKLKVTAGFEKVDR